MQAPGLMFGWRDITFYCKFIGLASMLVRLCLVEYKYLFNRNYSNIGLFTSENVAKVE